MTYLPPLGVIQYPLLAYSLITFAALWMCIQNPTLKVRRTARSWGLLTLVLGILGTAVQVQPHHFEPNLRSSTAIQAWLIGPGPTSLTPLIWGLTVASIAVVGIAMTRPNGTNMPYQMTDSESSVQ